MGVGSRGGLAIVVQDQTLNPKRLTVAITLPLATNVSIQPQCARATCCQYHNNKLQVQL